MGNDQSKSEKRRLLDEILTTPDAYFSAKKVVKQWGSEGIETLLKMDPEAINDTPLLPLVSMDCLL